MPLFAIIASSAMSGTDFTGKPCAFPAGAVMRIVLADNLANVHAPSGTTAQISNGTSPYTAPVQPPTVIPTFALLNRFTFPEQVAVWQAATAYPGIGVGLQTGIAAGEIDLTDQNFAAWLQNLVAAGVITADRATAISTP